MSERHDITQNADGVWWCDTEDCITEECTDLDRCANGCCCNHPDC